MSLRTSPELVPLFICFSLFWGSVCFPLTRQKRCLFAGVLIPAYPNPTGFLEVYLVSYHIPYRTKQ